MCSKRSRQVRCPPKQIASKTMRRTARSNICRAVRMHSSPAVVSVTRICRRSPHSSRSRFTHPSASSARTMRETTGALTPSMRRRSLWRVGYRWGPTRGPPHSADIMSKRAAVSPSDANGFRVMRRKPWNARLVPKAMAFMATRPKASPVPPHAPAGRCPSGPRRPLSVSQIVSMITIWPLEGTGARAREALAGRWPGPSRGVLACPWTSGPARLIGPTGSWRPEATAASSKARPRHPDPRCELTGGSWTQNTRSPSRQARPCSVVISWTRTASPPPVAAIVVGHGRRGGARDRGERRDRPLAVARARDRGPPRGRDARPHPVARADAPVGRGELHGQHHGQVPARPGGGAPRGRHGVPPGGAPLDARRARPGAGAPDQRRGDAQRAAHGAEPVVAPRPRRPVLVPELHRRVRPAVAGREARRRPGARGAVERPDHDVRLQQALLRAPGALLHVLRAAARRARRRRAPRLPRAPVPGADLGRDGADRGDERL